MKKGNPIKPGLIHVIKPRKECKSLEEQLRLMMSTGEKPLTTTAVTYNPRKDGVLPQHDIRTDRFEVAMLATDTIHASKAAERKLQDFPIPTDEKGKIIPSGGEA